MPTKKNPPSNDKLLIKFAFFLLPLQKCIRFDRQRNDENAIEKLQQKSQKHSESFFICQQAQKGTTESNICATTREKVLSFVVWP